MKMKMMIAAVLCLIGGCCIVNQKASIAPPAVYRTGGIPASAPIDAPLFRVHPLTARLMATPLPAAFTIPSTNLMPVIYQQASDCGPCDLAAIAFPATGQQLSPRATYVWEREAAKTYPADSGTTAAGNIAVAKNLGQPRTSVWPYAGDINAIPTAPAVADALNYKLTPLLTPDQASMEAAVYAGHPVCTFVFATTEWYYPIKCADGSYEVATPTASSTSIGGHFPTIVGFDHGRKCLDGSIGAMLMQNSWGTGWGNQGFAWISVAGWIAKNGDAGSRFTLVGSAPPLPPPPPPPPPAPTHAPMIAYFMSVAPGQMPPHPQPAGTPTTLYWSIAPLAGTPIGTLTVTVTVGGKVVYSGPLAVGSVSIGSPADTTACSITAGNGVLPNPVKNFVVVVQ